jgi:hypothetical protein
VHCYFPRLQPCGQPRQVAPPRSRTLDHFPARRARRHLALLQRY